MKEPETLHAKLFKHLSKESLTRDKAEELVTEMLKLSWVKRFLVFSDQAILLLEIHTLNYLYASPSIKYITGYDPEEFVDFQFIASIISSKEMQITGEISNLIVTKITDLKLQPNETNKLQSTRNTWIRKKDGTEINLLQHGFIAVVNEQGNPLAQILILTDITSYNKKQEHFYSLTMMQDDGSEKILLSGRIGNSDTLISQREQEILKSISIGYSSRDIAKQLHISSETVKTHRKNLLEKTNSKNSIDLVRHGYAHGWL